jgi:hypothetical protein
MRGYPRIWQRHIGRESARLAQRMALRLAVQTLNSCRLAGPKAVLMATSPASHPRAISTCGASWKLREASNPARGRTTHSNAFVPSEKSYRECGVGLGHDLSALSPMGHCRRVRVIYRWRAHLLSSPGEHRDLQPHTQSSERGMTTGYKPAGDLAQPDLHLDGGGPQGARIRGSTWY